MAEKAKKVEFFWGNVNLGGKLLYTESSENLTSCISKDSYFIVFCLSYFITLFFLFFYYLCTLVPNYSSIFFNYY